MIYLISTYVLSDVRYITFQQDYILSCLISAGHLCRLNRALHPVDCPHSCSFHLLKNAKRTIRKFCKVSIINQTTDKAISFGQNLKSCHYFKNPGHYILLV